MAEKKSEKNVPVEKKLFAETSALELTAAALGAMLVIGTIGFLLYSAITKTGQPPVLVVKQESVMAVEGGYLVKFTLENKGETTAAAVNVEGKLLDGEKEIETSSATISYAPSNSKREGGMFFTKDPATFLLKLRASGYENP